MGVNCQKNIFQKIHFLPRAPIRKTPVLLSFAAELWGGGGGQKGKRDDLRKPEDRKAFRKITKKILKTMNLSETDREGT